MALISVLRSYTAHRVIVAGLSFGIAILAARVLPSETFATLMTAAFLAKFLQILNLGATAGYFVSRYSNDGPLAKDDLGVEKGFLLIYLAQMALVAALAYWISSPVTSDHSLGTIAFLFLVPLFVLEPAMRYRRQFSFSLTPELLLSIALLAAILGHLVNLEESRLPVVYLITVGLGAFVTLSLGIKKYSQDWRGRKPSLRPLDYFRVIQTGGPVYLGTAFFLLASSMDRLLLPLHGSPEQISIYFLAHQLSVGAMILVTAINFVNTVDLGEARQNQTSVDPRLVFRKLAVASGVAAASYVTIVLAAYVMEIRFLPHSFDGLGFVVAVLGAGLACFFVSNSITPVVAYFKRQIPLTVSMAAVALVLAGNNVLVYLTGQDVIWLAIGTALTLCCYAAFAIWFTFFVLRQESNGPHETRS